MTGIRLKALASLQTSITSAQELPFLSLDLIQSGTGRLIEDAEPPSRMPPETGAAEAQAGDVLFGKLRPYLAKSLRVDRRSYASTELLCLRPSATTESRWLAYVVQSRPFVDWATASSDGTKMPRTSWEKLGEFRVDQPERSQQRAIADHLDTETTRFDALIAKKRRLCVLVDERAEKEIRHRLHTMGAPWLPLKRRWRVIDCKHRTPTYLDEGYPVVSPGDATPGRLELARAHRFVGEDDYRDLAEPPRRPTRGDIIYSRNASIGIAAYVDTDQQFCMGQDVCLITSPDQNQLFLTYALNTVGVDQLDRAKIGSTFSRVNVAQILEVSIPCPDPTVQAAVAAEFDCITERRDRTRQKLERQIDLLIEHRQALITAAVTGELSVPGVAA